MELFFVLLVGAAIGVVFKDKILEVWASLYGAASDASYEASRHVLEKKVKNKDVDDALKRYIGELIDEILKYDGIEEDEVVQHLRNNMDRVKYEFVNDVSPGLLSIIIAQQIKPRIFR